MFVCRSWYGHTLVFLSSVTVAGGSMWGVAPAVAQSRPAECVPVISVFVPGTWETDREADPARPVGMLAPVAEAVSTAHGDAVRVYTVPYMARAFDNGHTYADSKADAVARTTSVLTDIARSCPTTAFTLTGYSQGADAVGDIASDIGHGRGPIEADRVLAVGLLADPGAGTAGVVAVGPRTVGQGIADSRPDGMGALTGRVASICAPADLYCSIDKTASPLLGSLGTLLSRTPGSGRIPPTGTEPSLAGMLTSDFEATNLPGLASEVTALRDHLTASTLDFARVATTARNVAATLAPLADLLDTSGADPSATQRLAAAPTGSPQHAAGDVLHRAHESDLTGALDLATSIAETAEALARHGSPDPSDPTAEIQRLAGYADTLSDRLAPLTSVPEEVLGSATEVLSVLEPTVMVDQVLTVVTGMGALDMSGIAHNLTVLPQKIAAGDARGAHLIAGELNNQFAPLVQMAADVDLRWVSRILAMIPDPTGTTRIAAVVTSLVANVEVLALADLVGRIQEIAWTAVEKLFPPPGIAPDPMGAAAAMTGLVPVGVDLASMAVDLLSRSADPVSPELAGARASTPSIGSGAESAPMDPTHLPDALTHLSGTVGSDALASLLDEGLSAASFFTSTAHTDYPHLVVDNAGRTALDWLSEWLALQIGRAV